MQHPIIAAISPLVDAVGARIVSPDEAEESDLCLHYDGEPFAVVRLPNLHGALERQVSMVETEMGEPLSELSFDDKRTAVKLLEARGAFTIRKGAEQIADALGVSRFTIYNYLNASRNDTERDDAEETRS
ncbi:helix-turn-helix domain-containing protein [soil metagenome]